MFLCRLHKHEAAIYCTDTFRFRNSGIGLITTLSEKLQLHRPPLARTGTSNEQISKHLKWKKNKLWLQLWTVNFALRVVCDSSLFDNNSFECYLMLWIFPQYFIGFKIQWNEMVCIIYHAFMCIYFISIFRFQCFFHWFGGILQSRKMYKRSNRRPDKGPQCITHVDCQPTYSSLH